MKSNYSALAKPVKLTWRDGLLVPDTIPMLAPIDRAALDERARRVFMELLARYNKQDRTVSSKERANNFAPKEFMEKDEASMLAPAGANASACSPSDEATARQGPRGAGYRTDPRSSQQTPRVPLCRRNTGLMRPSTHTLPRMPCSFHACHFTSTHGM